MPLPQEITDKKPGWRQAFEDKFKECLKDPTTMLKAISDLAYISLDGKKCNSFDQLSLNTAFNEIANNNPRYQIDPRVQSTIQKTGIDITALSKVDTLRYASAIGLSTTTEITETYLHQQRIIDELGTEVSDSVVKEIKADLGMFKIELAKLAAPLIEQDQLKQRQALEEDEEQYQKACENINLTISKSKASPIEQFGEAFLAKIHQYNQDSTIPVPVLTQALQAMNSDLKKLNENTVNDEHAGTFDLLHNCLERNKALEKMATTPATTEQKAKKEESTEKTQPTIEDSLPDNNQLQNLDIT